MQDHKQVKIGVSWLKEAAIEQNDEDTMAYMEAIQKAGAIPVYLNRVYDEPSALKELNRIDGLIMSGGEDLDPALYHESKTNLCGDINPLRDQSDVILFKTAIKHDFPVLAVCRGMQLLNVLCGGSLYQDFKAEVQTNIIHRDPACKVFVKHDINVFDGNHLADALGQAQRYCVNSWHHQAIKTLGQNLEVIAEADDHIIEAINLKTANYIYGVQFHPERLVKANHNEYLALFKALIEVAKNRE